MNFLRRVFANGLDADLIRLFRMLLPYKGLIALACIFLIGAASMSSLTATLLGKLTDLGFYQEEKWVIFAAPAALIGVSLLFAVSTVMSSILMAKVSQSVLVTLRTELFERMLHWPAEAYQKFSTGTVSSKFVNEANIALSGATNSIIVLVRDIVQVIALLAVLFWHNWQLTLVAFVIAPGLALILRAISRRMRMIVKRSQEALAAMISRVQESYGAARIVKVAGTYDFEDERFAQINGRIRSLAMKTIQTQSLSTPLTQMLTMVAIAFVVGAALFQAQQGLLTFGEFITFLAAMLLLRTPIQALSGLNGTFAAMSTAAKSIFDMLDAELESDKGTIRLGRAKGEIRFEHVFLKYPGQTGYALQDINLTIKPGEHVALVGQSGSGKTSIVNLLPRFWELTSFESHWMVTTFEISLWSHCAAKFPLCPRM
ncbi:ABC transporter transmembrane domain-containing protein [Sutterella wadsworthensis]|uniref:ABC transporter transmembrane domain-containing protein n=1 Tax=Sutterella wadsworthensis TaxID=40545 RepID=UPI003967BA14